MRYAWLNKGNALVKLGKFEDAIAALDKAIEIRPDSAGAWHNKGVALVGLGKPEEAILAYSKAIELIQKIPMYGITKAMFSGCWVAQETPMKL